MYVATQLALSFADRKAAADSQNKRGLGIERIAMERGEVV
jgi:hypothetical protein